MNAIEFDHVGKQYRLGLVSTGTFSQDLNRWWTMNIRHKEDPNLKIGETNDRSKKGDSNYVWALKDINFNVEQGDVVGIIGKNGAGKSTLLKLLSRVTTPTVGEIRARGRIASLLEVGTGFHPEMTGRENIFMNGAIMGMTKAEISRKLDEIIDFSGCERYIDTPVKRYSSGMTVRLGFAIAAHLEPEILVVDEVLAVGDAEFQKKAIGKMQDVSKGGGRTVLFVSHNMASIRSLCTTGVLLENGMVKTRGTIDQVINEYISGYDLNKRFCKWKVDNNIPASITEVRVSVEGKTDEQLIDMTDKILVRISYEVKEDLHHTNICFSLYRDSVLLFHSWDTDNSLVLEQNRRKGSHIASFALPGFLLPGVYNISVDIGRPNIGVIQRKEDCLQFEISNVLTDGERQSFTRGGLVKTNIKWEDIVL
jgi:lipopolysaccharide transport system ATP-binding protein